MRNLLMHSRLINLARRRDTASTITAALMCRADRSRRRKQGITSNKAGNT